MSAPAPDDRIFHVVYSWTETNLLGGRGYGPIATSLPEDSDLRLIDQGLSPFMRAADSQDASRPPWSVCLIRGQTWSAVLHRARNETFDRHDVGHALVGRLGIFHPELALGLADWPGWRTDHADRHEFPTLRKEDLADRLLAGTADLDRRAAAHATSVTATLSLRLANETAKLGVLVPEDVSPADTVGTLWGVHRIAGLLTRGLGAAARPFDTFSTYAPGLASSAYANLDLVCAPAAGVSGSFEMSRKVARPFAAAPTPDPVAATLANEYFIGGVAGLQKFLQARGVYEQNTLSDRLKCLSGVRRPAETTIPQPTERRHPQPPPGPSPVVPHYPAPHPGVVLDQAVALVDGDPRTLLANLPHLDTLTAQLDGQARMCFSDYLAERRFGTRRLRRALPRRQAQQVLRVLVAAAIGPDPGKVSERQWRSLLDAAMPDEIVAIACEHCAGHGVWAPLLPWLELRYLRRNGFPGNARREPWHRRLAALARPALGIALLIGLTVGIAFGAWLTT